jgi:rubrerythrin
MERVMNVFEYAMQMEKDGEAYYRDLAKKTENAGLKSVLKYLADEEVKHYIHFQKMKDGAENSLPPSNFIDEVKNIFVKMKDDGDNYDFGDDQVPFYKKAIETEKKAEAFYREKAGETRVIHERALLNSIADEEKIHATVLEGIVDFIQEPIVWLENAEWGQLKG